MDWFARKTTMNIHCSLDRSQTVSFHAATFHRQNTESMQKMEHSWAIIPNYLVEPLLTMGLFTPIIMPVVVGSVVYLRRSILGRTIRVPSIQ